MISGKKDSISFLSEKNANREFRCKFQKARASAENCFCLCNWITGFDVQSLSTVYLDKPMRNHTLMQTIARANRVFEGKSNGLIVDYVGVFRNLQKALSIYAKHGQDGINAPVKIKNNF